jgi:pimeloyl-ACP methyl ester carboxylesterase
MTRQEYVVDGAGPALVLLHGGLSNRDDFVPQLAELTAQYRVWRRALMASLARAVRRPTPRSLLRGRSLGCARRRPELVRKLVLMGLYVNRDGEAEWFGRFVRAATASSLHEPMRSAYEARSPDGPEHFDEVAEKIPQLWRTEPNLPLDALRGLSVPRLLLQGDDDIVTLEHGVAMARAIRRAQLAVVPGASAVPYERPALVAQLFVDFLADEQPPKYFTAEALGV